MEPIETVVTKRESGVDHPQVAVTHNDSPNILIKPMHPLAIVGVRSLRVYLQTVLGILTAAGVGADNGMLPNEFFPLLLVALQLALAPVVFTALQNAVELFARIDVTSPKVRA